MTVQGVELLRGIVEAYEQAMAREDVSPQVRERIHNRAMLGSPEGARGLRWTDPDEQVPLDPEIERRFGLERGRHAWTPSPIQYPHDRA